MNPGGGGPGQGHGRHPSRATGTIPKIKHHNDISMSLQQNHSLNQNSVTRATLGYSGIFSSQQKPSSTNVPKNQVPPSWPTGENSPRSFRKNGSNNTSGRSLVDEFNDSCGIFNELYVLTGPRPGGLSQADFEENGHLESISFPALRRARMNGHDLTVSSPSSCSSQTNNETCRNEIYLEQSRQCEQKKSNNVPRMQNCSLDSSCTRSLQSPSISGGQSGSIPNTICLNGQGDTVNKSSEFNNRNELKMKLEEEERKLHALQEKQSILLQRRKQMLNSPLENHRLEDSGHGDALPRERAVDGRPNDCNNSRMGSEFHLLQANGHFEVDGIELRDGESSEDSAVEDSLDDYMEAHSRAQVQGQIVRDKLAEINCLRAQLKQVKGLISMAQRSPVASSRSESSNAQNSEYGSCSEQAVNIRRQRSSQHTNTDERLTNSSERGTANLRPDSKQSNASTKAEELEHEKARLRHLQSLIARVQEYHSSNLPIPEYLLAELKSETDEGTNPRQITNCRSERPGAKDRDEEFVDVEHVDNDENAVPVRRTDQNGMPNDQDCFYPEQSVHSRRSKAVNVESDCDRKLDVGEMQIPPSFTSATRESLIQPSEGMFNTDETGFGNRCSDRNQTPPRRGASLPKAKTRKGLVRVDGAVFDEITLRPDLATAVRGAGGTVSFVGLDEFAPDGRSNAGNDAEIHPVVREEIREAIITLLKSSLTDYPEIGPSSIWEITMWDFVPLEEQEAIFQNVRENILRRRDHNCSYDQRPVQQPEGQPQGSLKDESDHRRAHQISQHNNAAIPDAAIQEDWNSIPEPEDTSNSISHPLNPDQYRGNRPENNSASSSNVNIFGNAQEVQNRLRTLSQSYQGLLTEAHMEVLPGNRPEQMYAAVMSNVPPPVNIPPPSSMANSCDREHYYQQLFAASQLQQQQVLVTAINQCYHLLWLQNQELAKLRSAVHVMTSNAAQMSGIPQGQEPWGISPPSPAPVPPTLNNQVPPGNRTNNYWDNFRSYSRQNLLSAGQAKSNEVFTHYPTPLAERSHNTKSNEVFPHYPTPLAERSHNALHQQPSNSAPVTQLPSALSAPGTTASALPMLSPLGGFPGQLTGTMLATMTSASFAPGPSSSSQHPEGHDVDGGLAAPPESTHMCRKDKQNLAFQVHQNQQARNISHEANRQTEALSSGTCDLHPLLLPQENSPLDMEVPIPMPSFRPHLSLYQRLSNPLSDYPVDSPAVANRSGDTSRSRNQVGEFPAAHENINESNPGRVREENWNPRQNGGSSSWIGRRNWNNMSWTPNFQVDAQGAHTVPEFRFNNVSVPENQPGMSKRNGIHKRGAAANQNYQRNIHSSGAAQPNPSRNISTPSYQHNNDSEPHNKLSKNPPGFESSRNFLMNQRPDGQVSRGFAAPTNSNHHETAEQDDQPTRCNPSGHLNAASSLSESDLQAGESNKNHLKENRLQMNRSPKCQSKPATPGGQVLGTNGWAGSKSNQTAGSSKRNQDSAVRPSSSTNRPEDIRDAILAEMASLMSAKENQQILARMLRDLQVVSTDTQTENHPQAVQSVADSLQIEEASSTFHGEPVPEDDERIAKESQSLGARLLSRIRASQPGERQASCSQVFFDRSCSLPECETRGTTPSDTGDKFKDLAVELSAYIRAHLQDTCTSSMIDEISSLVLMFVPFARNSHSFGRSNSSQLEGLLGNALHRFQGRRLEVVCDELTSVILKVLTNELTFVHLIDSVDHNSHEVANEASGTVQETAPYGWSSSESGSNAAHVSSTTGPEAFCSPPALRGQDEVDLMEIALVAELNGDLAEADQSHSSSLANGDVAMNRSLGHRPDVAMEEELSEAGGVGTVEENAMCLADSRPQSCEPKKECEPHTVPDRLNESLRSTSSAKEQPENSEGEAAAAVNQEWEESCEENPAAPQAIDHGLDHIPIRLTGELTANQALPTSDSTSQ